jgi:tetratricopeptide (TPR) repeat protein
MTRQPIGATFVVSLVVLGLVAALQVFAIVYRYAGVAKQMLREKATAGARVETSPESDPPISPYRPTPSAANTQTLPLTTGPDFEERFKEADRSYRLGDFETALKQLEQLETIAPGNPRVLASKAEVLEKLDQPAEAILILEEVLKMPGLTPDVRANIKKKIEILSESAELLSRSTGSAPKTSMTTQALPEGEPLREATGIRPGATLGIIDIRVKEQKRGKKTLSVSVKSLPGAEIASDKVKILAYFYELTEDGEAVLTDSNIGNQWMSPPIDWADNEPEILDLEYTLPEFSGAEPGRKYLGYVVGLYYNGELQDYRSDPVSLSRRFPLPLGDSQ